jgi:hypothetical protein
MQDPARIPQNLLVLLYRLAHRQQENFATESFAHLLQYLIEGEPSAAARVLDWLTNSSFFSQRNAGAPLSVQTQFHTDEHGIPDVRIESDDLDVIIEVKLDGSLTFEQADAYSKELTRRARPCRALVALTGSTPAARLPDATIVRTWGALGVRLRDEARASESELTHHLVDQFAGLLNHLQLLPLQVRPLSARGRTGVVPRRAGRADRTFIVGRLSSQGIPSKEVLT